MKSGWVRNWRKMERWGWYKNANAYRVFMRLIAEANYQESHLEGHLIKIGDVATSKKALSLALGIPEGQVRTALTNLTKTGDISQNSTNHFTIITVCNYEKYNSYEKEEQQPDVKPITTRQQPDDNPITDGLQTDDNPISTSKKGRKKEGKNEEFKNEENTKRARALEPIISEIISDLNLVLGTEYRASSKATQKLINARISDGFGFEDFQTVHRNKFEDWAGKPDMVKYLRPETLYSNKFEGYLNQIGLNYQKMQEQRIRNHASKRTLTAREELDLIYKQQDEMEENAKGEKLLRIVS